MIRMSRNTTRSATVSVNWKDTPAGKNPAAIHFEPREVDEATWTDLTSHIADAQKHIITITGKDVARDVVSIKVAGPQCEDLTLIDLPGIVRSTGKGESETLSRDVQSLIDDYLKNSRCVILAVHPVNVDFHNSQIMDEAKKVDPVAKRTLPVLTKPDIIDKGAEGGVKELLLGEKTVGFERGFHMVKGRGQAALNRKESIEKGLQDEEAFFRATQPWRDVADKSLFGTQALRRKLGLLQMELVRATLPDIIKEIQSGRDEAAKKLQILGSAPTSMPERRLLYVELREAIVFEVRSLLSGSTLRQNGRVHSTRSSSIIRHVERENENDDGSEGEEESDNDMTCSDDESEGEVKSDNDMTCSAMFLEHCEEFMNALGIGRLATISNVSVGVQAIAVIGSDEVKGQVVAIFGDSIFLDKHGSLKESAHGRNIGDVWIDKSNLRSNGVVCFASRKNQYLHLHAIPSKNVRRDSDWIMSLIKKHRPYKLPIFVNTEVFEQIVKQGIESDWRQPCLDLVGETFKLLKSVVEGVLEDQSQLSSFPRLREFLHFRIERVAEQEIRSAREKVVDYLRRESKPYTQNHYLNENVARLRSKRLEESLMEALALESTPGGLGTDTMAKSSIKSVIKGVFERNQKKSVDEHMGEDMQHALDAYGKVAMKRFIDVVPMLCGDVLQNFPDMINKELCQVSDEQLEKFVCVASDDLTKRKNLTRKFDELEHGLQVMKELF
jgi:Dynamin central region/Dynamin family